MRWVFAKGMWQPVKQEFENKEALPFPCYNKDIQRCWNRVVKLHVVRLDMFCFIILCYCHVNLVIYKPSVTSGTIN